MDEKFLNDLLSRGIKLGHIDLELNDTIVDSLLETSDEVSVEAKARVKSRLKAKIVEVAIASARPSIAWKGLPFGRYLEQVRNRAGLTRIAVAEWLGQTDEYLLRVERGDASPTELPTKDVVHIIELFHIRLRAVSEMLLATVHAAQSKQTYRAAARSHGGLRHDVRSEDVERALDAFTRKIRKRAESTNEANINQASSEVRGYLVKLETELRKRGRVDLLS